MEKPILNLSRYSSIVYTDLSEQTTNTAPTLSSLAGKITDTQLPTSIGAGSSLDIIDAGTY